ncbi:MAG: hypothetical protein HZB61_08290 [Nitrospirae bacterium]|nr:hypothetical protein [Nitrospirota bacterium]
MKAIRIMLLSLLVVGLICSFAFAESAADKGKALFNDAKFAGGTSGKSCGSCHMNGKGLEKAADKKEFNLAGKKQASLEEAVNVCIVNQNKGTAIDANSDDMKSIVAYIKSLKPKKKATGGY